MQAIDLRAIVIGASAIITTRHIRVQLVDSPLGSFLAATRHAGDGLNKLCWPALLERHRSYICDGSSLVTCMPS